MAYESYPLLQELAIDRLYSFLYYELDRSFVARGEKHGFWEFVYVDKGQVEIVTDDRHYWLEPGQLIFYKPNQFHRGRAHNNTAPNLMIVSFDCHSPHMDFFSDRLFILEERERALLSELLQEGINAFDPLVTTRGVGKLKGRHGAVFGCEQLIKNYTETLLIRLIRKGIGEREQAAKPASVSQINKGAELTDRIIAYMKANLASRFTVDELCRTFALGKSQLNALFRARTGAGPMEYCHKLRIDAAKTHIREQSYNMTEIAERLGYNSIHYFSRAFKQATNMTLTEYARSVRARSERR